MTAFLDPATASVVWHTPTFATGSAKWTSTVTPRLLVEGGVSFNRERYDNLYQDGIQAVRGTPAWYRTCARTTPASSYQWNAGSAQLGNYPDRYNVIASTSYVTGSHSVKVRISGFVRALSPLQQCERGSVSDVPESPATASDGAQHAAGSAKSMSTPTWVCTVRIRGASTNSRSTSASASITSSSTSSVRRRRSGGLPTSFLYDDIDMPVWNDISPRTSVVYDVFGNGKTAIRAGFNKFMTAATTGFAQLYNPTALSNTLTLPWTDKNKDDIAQGERGCAFANDPACEINFANLPANFGVRSLSTFDPNLQRPYQLGLQPWRLSRSVQRHCGHG